MSEPKRFRASRPVGERFMEKVSVGTEPDACWSWRGSKSPQGYSRIYGGPGVGPLLAHRVAYELFVGPIEAGKHIDHLCHTNDPTCFGDSNCPHRGCVNPWHLEAVAPGENIMRGRSPRILTVVNDVCQRGHAFSADAYTVPKTGKRRCRACRNERRRAGAA